MQWELRPERRTGLAWDFALPTLSGVSGLDASSPSPPPTRSSSFLGQLHHSQFLYSLDSWKKVPEISGRQRKGRQHSFQGGTKRVTSQARHPGLSLPFICLSWVGASVLCVHCCPYLRERPGASTECLAQAGPSQCPIPSLGSQILRVTPGWAFSCIQPSQHKEFSRLPQKA